MNGRFLCEPASGVQRVARGFLGTLDAAERPVLLVAPTGSVPDWYVGPRRTARLPPGRPGRLLWEQFVLPALVGGRPVVSLANTAPVLRCDVAYVHDVAVLAHPEWYRPTFRYTYGRSTTWAARRAGCVVVPSVFTADELRRRLGVDTSRVSVVPPGVDDHFRRPEPAALDEVRDRYRLPGRFVLGVGSHGPRKGLAVAARAAGAVGLPILVTGSRETPFRAAPRGVGVGWLGRVGEPDLPAVYAAATVLVYPSVYEGFGLPPLEAMACGTPVVASDIPVVREVAGSACIRVPPGDVDAWADGLRLVTGQPAVAAELRAAGFAQAARYRWSAAGAQLSNVLAGCRR